jgi:hypothetical protein
VLWLRAANRLIGVEYDHDATAAAIRARCAQWLEEADPERPAAFGVRTAPVGLRRRRVGIVHHGAPIRYRTADLSTAVEALASVLSGMESRPGPGDVHVDARLFVRGDQAVVLMLPSRVDLDDRPLKKAGIEEVPGWRVAIDARTGEVSAGDRRLPLSRIVVADIMAGSSLDGSRRHIWAASDGDTDAWAEFLDRHGDLIARVDEKEAGAAVLAGLA